MWPVNQEKPLWRWAAASRSFLLQLSDLAAPACCANTTNCCAGSSEGEKTSPFSSPSRLPCPPHHPHPQLPCGATTAERWEAAVRGFVLVFKEKKKQQTAAVPARFPLPLSISSSIPTSSNPYLGPHSGTQCSPQNMWFLLASGAHARAHKRTKLSVTHPKPGVPRHAHARPLGEGSRSEEVL